MKTNQPELSGLTGARSLPKDSRSAAVHAAPPASKGVNRRTFLQAGIAAGAVLAAGGLQAADAKPLKSVRIGMVGMGGRGTSLLETLLMLADVEIVAVCDLLSERTDQARRMVERKTGRTPEAYVKGDFGWRDLVRRDDLDAIIIATPWEWHTQMAVGAMRAGKYAGVEVPAAITLDECWDLARASEESGKPCMMLENVCYFQNVMSLLRMAREGLFGDLLHCEAGYQHDCRSLLFDAQGNLTWRGRHAAEKNGNLYPTHAIGPVAQWLDINRGDCFTQLTSLSTPAKGMRRYAAARWGKDHPAVRNYAQGDVNTTLIKTANGLTVTLYFDLLTPRPYDLILRLQGCKGIYMGAHNQICLEKPDASPDQWESFDPYMEKYPHPLWTAMARQARESGGHGGSDYIMLYDFVKAVRNKTQTPQDVYDAATWSAVFPLSIQSVAQNGAVTAFPDFTRGKWKTNRPSPLGGA